MASAASDSDKILTRDELLAHFQNATGIDDVNVCIRFLENNRWKLQDAIETALAASGDLRSIGVGSASVGVEKTADDVDMMTAHDLDSASSECEGINPFRALLTRDDSVDDLYSRQPPFELDSQPPSTDFVANESVDCVNHVFLNIYTGEMVDVTDEKNLINNQIWCLAGIGSTNFFPPTTFLNRTFIMSENDAADYLEHLERFNETVQWGRQLSKRVLIFERGSSVKRATALVIGYMMTVTQCDVDTCLRYLRLPKRLPGADLHVAYKTKLQEYQDSDVRMKLRQKASEIREFDIISDSKLIRYSITMFEPPMKAVDHPMPTPKKDEKDDLKPNRK